MKTNLEFTIGSLFRIDNILYEITHREYDKIEYYYTYILEKSKYN